MSDNIDQQVKFKSTSQEVYDNLTEKDPNSLYFAEDTQRIYKGDTQFSDGSVDEDKFVKIYKLSEEEFWNKFNSGDLQVGQYLYPTVGLVTDYLSSDIMYKSWSGVTKSNGMYYIMSYGLNETPILTQISDDFTQVKSVRISRYGDNSIGFDAEPCGFPSLYPHSNCIGCDNLGYLYMGAKNVDGDSLGIISVDTANIEDRSSWSLANKYKLDQWELWFRDSKNTRVSFRPFNRMTSYASGYGYDPTPIMYQDPLLLTKEGGLFGFVFSDYSPDKDTTRSTCKYRVSEKFSSRIKYCKAGICKEFSLPDDAPRDCRHPVSGPRCFTTNPDNDNKLYYMFSPYDGNTSNVMISSLDADGSLRCYNVVIDSSTSNGFTSAEAEFASFVRCKNNKVFAFIGNTNPVCAVLDLVTGEYTNVTKFANFIFDAKQEYSTVSNIVEADNSICFTVFNGEICQYVCWNYLQDKIYSVKKRIAMSTKHRFDYNASCDILRQGQSNSIIAYSSDFSNQCVKIETLSCDNLSVINSWTLDNLTAIDEGYAVAPIRELSDGSILVMTYAGDPAKYSTKLSAATIDQSGNIKYCSNVGSGLSPFSSNFNRSALIPTSMEDNYLLVKMDAPGNGSSGGSSASTYVALIDLKNYNVEVCDTLDNTNLRPLVLDDNLLSVGWSTFTGISSYTTRLCVGLASYMSNYQNIRIINEGDITL